MRVFKETAKELIEKNLKPYALERNIQQLVENNIYQIFQLSLIKSEFKMNDYRIDSLCFDEESNSITLIEYKKGNSYSVIDQGFSYLQLILNNKSELVLALSQYYKKVMAVHEIDWSSSKIIFIAPSFNKYQRDSVNFKDLPFELWEIKRFEDSIVVFNEISTSTEASFNSLASSNNGQKSNITAQVVKMTEANHTESLSEHVFEMWEDIRGRLLNIDNLNFVPKKHYLRIELGSKGLCYISFKKDWFDIEMLRGNVMPDGSTSKKYFTLNDKNQYASERQWKWKSGVKGTIYSIRVKKNTDLDYVMYLIKQKYQSIIE